MKDKELEDKILEAVWNREIDQIYTSEIAERFGCSNREALRILKGIISGKYPDRFKESSVVPYPDGALISDGSTFTWNNSQGYGEVTKWAKNRQHICWFCT